MHTTKKLTRSLKPFVIRLTPELRNLLEGQACFKSMSLNALIVSILEDHAYRSVDLVDRVSKLENEFAAMQPRQESFTN